MTLYQVNYIVFHPRDEHGTIKPQRDGSEDVNERDRRLYFERMRLEGFNDQEISVLYGEKCMAESFSFSTDFDMTTTVETKDGKQVRQQRPSTQPEIEAKRKEFMVMLRKARPFMMR